MSKNGICHPSFVFAEEKMADERTFSVFGCMHYQKPKQQNI